MRVLRAVPGVYLQEEEGFGLRPNIGIRGSGLDRSARIALLEDGVLIAPAPYSAPSAYYFPTQRRMHSLEVLKGPASVVVGPRTTGGAINMISTPIPETTGGMIDLRVGDYNTNDAHLNFGNRARTFPGCSKLCRAKVTASRHRRTGRWRYRLRVAGLHGQSSNVGGFRFKLGYTEQTSDETYLGLTDADFAADPNRRYAASAGDVFDSEHEQYQVELCLRIVRQLARRSHRLSQ